MSKAQGGTDEQDNLQAICVECHWAKSGVEKGYKPQPGFDASGRPVWDETPKYGYSIPHGIEPSAIPVMLVCGPPASGKSTFIREHAKPEDTIIDFDVYLKQIGAQKWTADKAAVKEAFRIRDAHLRSLATKTQGRAWVIAMAPTKAERAAWRKALGSVTIKILDEPAEVCIARLTQDADRAHALDKMEDAIRDWWARYQRP